MLAIAKNQKTMLVKRKLGLLKMPAFWEHGGVFSKGHNLVFCMTKNYIDIYKEAKEMKVESVPAIPGKF